MTLNTGTVLGPGSNVFGTAMPSRYIPPFSWGTGSSLETYEVDKALAVAATVMRRRNCEPSASYAALFLIA